MKKALFLFFFFFQTFYLFAQTNKKDSLEKILEQENIEDSVRVRVLIELGKTIRKQSIVKALEYVERAIELSKNKEVLLEGYCLAQVEKNYILSRLYNYSDALQCLFDVLKVIDKVQDKNLEARVYTQIAFRYNDQANYQEALKNYRKAVQLYQKIDLKHPILPVMHNNQADTYLSMQKFDSALFHLSMAFQLEAPRNRASNIFLFTLTTAEVYLAKKDYEEANKYFRKALETHDNYHLETENYYYGVIFYAQTFIEIGKTKEAEGLLEKVKKIVGQDKYLQHKLYYVYYLFYKKQNNLALSIDYFEKAVSLKDSLQTSDVNKRTEQIRANYNFQIENSLLKKDAEQKKMQSYIFIFILLLFLIIVSILIYNNYQKQKTNKLLNTQKKQIESYMSNIVEKNIQIRHAYQEIQATNEELQQSQEEIVSQRDILKHKNDLLEEYTYKIGKSIEAAKLIQRAILPSREKMNTLFPEHFILFYPKDVVSGDFWWTNEVDRKKYLIVADCTGHGVAGAMLTMIGSSLLDWIIQVLKITEPAEILEKLHIEVQNVLQQEKNQNNEGMDIAVVYCCEQENTCELHFSAAKRPLYYVQDQKIEKIIGTRRDIGGKVNSIKPFTNHVVEFDKKTTIYLSSDGFIDQNNVAREKLGEKKLLKLLEKIQNLPIMEQKEVLKGALQDHMRLTEQRDDILMVGVMLNC